MPASRPSAPRPTGARQAAPSEVDAGEPTLFRANSERPIAAVQRALAVLNCLAVSEADLGTNEIARRVGTNASSVSRLLATLAREEFVRRIPSTGRYRLGLRLVELGHSALARVDLREMARPHLLALTALSGETATLSVPGEETPMTVDFVQSPASVRSVAHLGRPAVPHATATGKVFLAFRDVSRDHSERDGEGRERRGMEFLLSRYTRKTITDPQRLADELALVREHGWAQAVGEREEELNAVAVPVLAAGGELVAILGIQGPAGRFDVRGIRGVVSPLREHAQQLAAHVVPSHG